MAAVASVRRPAVTSLACGVGDMALAWAAGSPARAIQSIHSPDFAVALSSAAALAAWAVVGWLAITVVAATAAIAARAPGRLGRVATTIYVRTAPLAWRRAVEFAVGVAVTGSAIAGPALGASAATSGSPAGPAGIGPAAAAAAPATTTDHAIDLDRPVRVPVAGNATPAYVVRPGDTLWDIAARRLGPGATAAEIAQSWPDWYAGNRDIIGADPACIVPGQQLRPPAA